MTAMDAYAHVIQEMGNAGLQVLVDQHHLDTKITFCPLEGQWNKQKVRLCHSLFPSQVMTVKSTNR